MMPEKSSSRVAGSVEEGVELRRLRPEGRRGARRERRLLREPQVLQHQRGREARLVAVVGGRGRHRARHRAIGRERPALARGGRGDVEQGLMREAQLLGEHEGLRDADHRDAEDHVVADLGRLPGPCLAAMDDALAHLGEDRLGAGECARRAARHEGEGRRLRAADAAGDRRVEGRKPSSRRHRMRLAGALDVDGGGIDDERAGAHRRQGCRSRRRARACRRAAW